MGRFPSLAPKPTPEDAACPHISSCEMFGILTYAGTLGTWKARYCNGEFTSCARYQASSKGKKVPINLMPNGALLRKPGG